MKPFIVIVYVIKKRGEKFEYLLLKRCGKLLPGNWQMIAGKVQDGETAIDGALRELHEESGLYPDRFYSADYVESFFLPTLNLLCHAPVFVAFIDHEQDVKLSPLEHDDYQWVSFSEALSLLEFSGQKGALCHIKEEFVVKPPNNLFLVEV